MVCLLLERTPLHSAATVISDHWLSSLNCPSNLPEDVFSCFWSRWLGCQAPTGTKPNGSHWWCISTYSIFSLLLKCPINPCKRSHTRYLGEWRNQSKCMDMTGGKREGRNCHRNWKEWRILVRRKLEQLETGKKGEKKIIESLIISNARMLRRLRNKTGKSDRRQAIKFKDLFQLC